MHSTLSRLSYLGIAAGKIIAGQGQTCPSCASPQSTPVARKYAVTALRRCSTCQLLFRTPTTTHEENAAFYQREYSQGLTSDTPSPAALDALKASSFKETQVHCGRQIDVLRALGCSRGARVFDYGCSWGYGSWQLAEAGYDIGAFEISLPRAEYARNYLGIDVATREDDVHGSYDAFFSNHVLEHVPSVSSSLRMARRLLKSNGWFIAFTPNGSEAYRSTNEHGWMKSWGLVHPNLLDDAFYRSAFKDLPSLLASVPYDLAAIEHWGRSGVGSCVSLDLTGNELLAVARFVGCGG